MRRTVTYLTKAHLLRLRKIEADHKRPFNQAISDAAMKKLDPKTKFPVAFSMLHNTMEETRVQIMMNEQGAMALVDMPTKFFNKLPQATVGATA